MIQWTIRVSCSRGVLNVAVTKSRLQITKITKDYTEITGQAYEINTNP